MMTAGLKPRQFFWCELCSAYTGQRVRKLMHDCDRVNRSVPAVDALRKGNNPYVGSPLLTKPCQLCKHVLGPQSWSGEGRPDDSIQVCTDSATFSVAGDDSPCAVMSVLTSQHAEKEDPLRLCCRLE